MTNYSTQQRQVRRKRWIITLSAIFTVFLVLTLIFKDNTAIRPVAFDEFECVQHEEGQKFSYTISYRGNKFLANDAGVYFNQQTGEPISESTNDYAQISRCIQMYKFAQDGYVGSSPAELKDGEFKERAKPEPEQTPKEQIQEVPDSTSVTQEMLDKLTE